MSLIGNHSLFMKNPNRNIGTAQSTLRSNFNQSGADQNRFMQFDKFVCQPNGYRPPYTYVNPRSDGGLASTGRIEGIAGLSSANLAGGRNIETTIVGTGAVDFANLILILEFASSIIGTGQINNAALAAAVFGVCSISGSATVDAYIGATVSALCSMSGTGVSSADISGLAHLSADLEPFTELSPQALANAVWNALKDDYNTSGTMGEALAGAVGSDTSKLLTVAKFLALK